MSCIKYLDNFNSYKRFIMDNFDSPGMVTTFTQLNREIFNAPSPASGSTPNDQSENQSDDEEDRMRAEVWGEGGMSPPPPLFVPNVPNPPGNLSGSSTAPAHPPSPPSDPITSPHLPPSPALTQQPETSPTPSPPGNGTTVAAKKTRSKAGGRGKAVPKATGGGNDAAAEGVKTRSRKPAAKHV